MFFSETPKLNDWAVATLASVSSAPLLQLAELLRDFELPYKLASSGSSRHIFHFNFNTAIVVGSILNLLWCINSSRRISKNTGSSLVIQFINIVCVQLASKYKLEKHK